MSDYEQIRLICATDVDGGAPTVVGAISETIWEIIPDEDWNRIRGAMVAASEMDPRDSGAVIDVIVSVDYAEFKRLGQVPTLSGKVVATEGNPS